MKRVLNKMYSKRKGIGHIFNTFPNYIKLISLILIVILLISFIPIKVLLATDFKTNKYIKSWKIGKGESFTIEYTHSVELTPVSETYIIEDNKIILTESYFKSYGAGLPSTTPYKFEITDKGFRIYEINEVMEDIVYRTGAERANHRLILREKEYPFLGFTKPRSGVKFSVKNINILTYIAKEVIK
jgi:hypothetical protein